MTPPLPLRGRRIVVTRGTDKVDRLSPLLEDAGATVLRIPLITTARLLGDGAIRAGLARLGAEGADRPRWLTLSSEVAVNLVLEAVGASGLTGVSVAVVGPATAAALEAHGVVPAIVAPAQVAESLAAELVGRGVGGAAVLVVGAAGGRPVLAERLGGAGAVVEVLEAYRSITPPGAAARLRSALVAPLPDAITFTSASTVRHCSAALAGEPPPPIPALCIGPVTAAAARTAGWLTVATATTHTAKGLAGAALALLGTAEPLP